MGRPRWLMSGFIPCVLASMVGNPDAPRPIAVAAAPHHSTVTETQPNGTAVHEGEALAPARPEVETPRATPVAPTELSEAEQIAALQRTIEADQQRLRELEDKLKDHEEEFEKAGRQFRERDDELDRQRGKIEELREAGNDPEAAKLEASIPERDAQRNLAKERLEAAIELRRATRQQIAALREKIENDERSLHKLLDAKELPAGATQTAPRPAVPSRSEPEAKEPVPEQGSGDAVATSVSDRPPGRTDAPASEPAGAGRQDAVDGAAGLDDAKTAEARDKVAVTETAAQKAKEHVEDVEQRLKTLETSIRLEREAREAARKQADNAERTLALLSRELERKLAEEAGRRELDDVRSSTQEAQARLQRAREDLKERATALDRLETERAALLADRIAVLRTFEEERARAEAARAKLESLENPFALRNVVRWTVRHGPPIIAILLGMWAFRWLLRIGTRRLVRLLVLVGGRGNATERQERADVLAGILYKAAAFLVIVGGALLILAELGVEIAPLWTLVSAVFAMIAIGFVAVWSVASNALCALVLLVYQPFKVGSVVELPVAGVRGKVVNFNLIYTTLRGEEGDLIEVPNNTFFQQPIRHRDKTSGIGLEEQLTKEADVG